MENKILLTGGTGFVGSRVLPALLQEWSDVEVFVLGRSLPTSAGSHADRVRFLECDFSSASALEPHRELLQEVAGVVHLGGFILKSSKLEDDDLRASINSNLLFTISLLEALPPRLTYFVYASTLDVYGSITDTPAIESHPTQPRSFYGASKLATEAVLRVFAERSGFPATILRFTQIYGPGDTSSKAIPNFTRSIVAQVPPNILGDGLDERDHLFIDDAVASVLAAIKSRKNGTYNIATGQSYSMRSVLQNIILSAKSSALPQWNTTSSETPTKISLDIRAAEEDLDFSARTPISLGLTKTVAWFSDEHSRSTE